MRRLLVGLVTVVGVLGVGASPAAALDAGVATATSTYSGNESCLEPPGMFATSVDLTGTVTASGQTYVGSFTVNATGTYFAGACTRNDFARLRAFLDDGAVSGQNAFGTVRGTCGRGSVWMGAVVGLLAIPEPPLLGVFNMTCDVSVNGGAPQALSIGAELVGSPGPGTATHHGVYNIEPL